MYWMSYLERVNLLDWVSVEYQARRGKMLQRTAVALLATVCRCWVQRSCESSTRPKQRTPEAQVTKMSWIWRGSGRGSRLVPIMVMTYETTLFSKCHGNSYFSSYSRCFTSWLIPTNSRKPNFISKSYKQAPLNPKLRAFNTTPHWEISH